MSEFAGYVTNIQPNETSYGTMYNLEIDGQVYGMGRVNPEDLGVRIGSYVEFDATRKGRYFNITANSLNVYGENGEESAAPPPPPPRRSPPPQVRRAPQQRAAPPRPQQVEQVVLAAPNPPERGVSRHPPAAVSASHREDTISRHAARNSAIALLNVAQQAGVLPFSTAKKGQFEALCLLCNALTNDFYNYATGKTDTPPAVPAQSSEAKAVSGEPEDAADQNDGW